MTKVWGIFIRLANINSTSGGRPVKHKKIKGLKKLQINKIQKQKLTYYNPFEHNSGRRPVKTQIFQIKFVVRKLLVNAT